MWCERGEHEWHNPNEWVGGSGWKRQHHCPEHALEKKYVPLNSHQKHVERLEQVTGKTYKQMLADGTIKSGVRV